MTQQFPLLFTPFQLGQYTLQSRIVIQLLKVPFV